MQASSHRTRSSTGPNRSVALPHVRPWKLRTVIPPRGDGAEQAPDESDQTHQDPFAAIRSLSRYRYTRCNATKRPFALSLSFLPFPFRAGQIGSAWTPRFLDMTTNQPQNEATTLKTLLAAIPSPATGSFPICSGQTRLVLAVITLSWVLSRARLLSFCLSCQVP
jgi:hypothetical protein